MIKIVVSNKIYIFTPDFTFVSMLGQESEEERRFRPFNANYLYICRGSLWVGLSVKSATSPSPKQLEAMRAQPSSSADTKKKELDIF
jgi:hypothetical protein